MNHSQVVIIAALSLAAAPLFAAQPDLTRLPPPAQTPGVTYAKDIRPILEASSCLRCHGEQRARAQLRLDSLESALKGSENGKVITPGKSAESLLVIAVAQLDDETAMPPKRQPGRGPGGGRGQGGAGSGRPGGTNRVAAGRGAGGFPGGGGFGMFGRTQLAEAMVAQGDRNNDQKLSKAEFTGLADAWFDKLDPEKSGKLTQKQFTERLDAHFLPQDGAAPRNTAGPDAAAGGNSRPGGNLRTGFIVNGIFTAADADKDGSVTRAELKDRFEKWYSEWDVDKSGALSQEQLYAGLSAALPRQGFGGGTGFGPGGPGSGPGGGAGGPGGGGNGPAPKPLTKEQVSLVRAWIDQGAK